MQNTTNTTDLRANFFHLLPDDPWHEWDHTRPARIGDRVEWTPDIRTELAGEVDHRIGTLVEIRPLRDKGNCTCGYGYGPTPEQCFCLEYTVVFEDDQQRQQVFSDMDSLVALD